MNEKLTIQDLTDLLATKHGMAKEEAEVFVKEFFLLIEQSLQNESIVKIKGLGTFKLINVDTRGSVNASTDGRFQIKGHTKVSFTPDANLRDEINKPFAHFETVVLNENTILEDTATEEEEDENDEEKEIIDNPVITGAPIIKKETPVTMTVSPTVRENTLDMVVEQSQSSNPIQDIEKNSAEKIIAQVLIKANLQPEVPIDEPEEDQSIPATSTESITPEKEISQKEKSPVPYLAAIVFVVLLLCSGVILFIYYPNIFSSSTNNTLVIAQSIRPKTELQLTDTTTLKPNSDTIKYSAKKEIIEQKERPANYYKGSAAYKIKGTKTTYTIKKGESLSKLSVQFYGTKDLWEYILKYNRDVIKDADNVPFDITIKIPELTKE